MDFAKQHILSAGDFEFADDGIPNGADGDNWRKDTRKRVEPWLSALFQSDHLSLLVGSGMTTAVAYACGAKAAGMGTVAFGTPHEKELNAHITKKAAAMGRGEPNLEDQLSATFDQAFSGKLVPQDPNDEPASKLLKRIQAARAAAP